MKIFDKILRMIFWPGREGCKKVFILATKILVFGDSFTGGLADGENDKIVIKISEYFLAETGAWKIVIKLKKFVSPAGDEDMSI